ncbi:MAG: S1C family serine protease [Culicoidibacterales bacterium]
MKRTNKNVTWTLPQFGEFIEKSAPPKKIIKQPPQKLKKKWQNNQFLVGIFSGMLGSFIVCALFLGSYTLFFQEKAVVTKTGTTTVVTQNLTDEISLEQVVVENISQGVVTILVENNFSLVGSGSGVVYQKEGETIYIVTNAHVVEGGKRVKVHRNDLNKESSVSAKVLAVDTVQDIAVLSIENAAADFPVIVEFAKTEGLKIGQKVLAIGSPLGSIFSGSVTTGIISGLNRKIVIDDNSKLATAFIQTDAAINGGNSGGALVNMKGQLIGINSAKIQKTDNIGLAIPANTVVETMRKLGVPTPDSYAQS